MNARTRNAMILRVENTRDYHRQQADRYMKLSEAEERRAQDCEHHLLWLRERQDEDEDDAA